MHGNRKYLCTLSTYLDSFTALHVFVMRSSFCFFCFVILRGCYNFGRWAFCIWILVTRTKRDLCWRHASHVSQNAGLNVELLTHRACIISQYFDRPFRIHFLCFWIVSYPYHLVEPSAIQFLLSVFGVSLSINAPA